MPEQAIAADTRISRDVSWRALRDRLLASERFQAWASRFPPTRWIARRRARALFDLCAGFVYSQVLAACVTLRVFDHLAAGPLSLPTLAARLSLSEAAALRLLEAARSLGLVEIRRGNRYALGPLGAALRGNPGVMAIIAHHAGLYADLADPVALLRGETRDQNLAAYWPYAGHTAPAALAGADVAPYTTLMAGTQAMIAAQVLDAYPIAKQRVLLDVGGGDGSFAAAAAARAPNLRVITFDLPPVAERASERFARTGLAARASAAGGDFRADPLPTGADVISLVRVIHDHDDAVAFALLQKIRQALPPDGTLLLAEPMADTPGAEPIGHAYFGFYLLAMGKGRPRSQAVLAAMLREAGFSRVQSARTAMPMLTSVLVAKP